MNEEQLRRAKSVTNPFAQDRVDKAWDSDVIDVESINRTAFARSLESIELVRTLGQSRGLLLAGETGSGKTHLLQRVRRRVQQDDRDYFVYLHLPSAPDRFFRYLLQILMNDLVLVRPDRLLSQLETLVVRELLRITAQSKPSASAWWEDLRKGIKSSFSGGFGQETKLSAEVFWADVCQRNKPGETLFAWLEPRMERIGEEQQIDRDVSLALRYYLARYRRQDALHWLSGKSLSEAVLNRMEIARSIEVDHDAFDVIKALSKLAGRSSVFVLAFDQLEGLQVNLQDKLSLNAFANGVVELFVECRNVSAISCVQNYFRKDLESAVPLSHMDKLAQDQGSLTLLDKDAALDLVVARLGTVPELNKARQSLEKPDPVWPLNMQGIQGVIPASGIPARELIKVCSGFFEAWRRGETTQTVPGLPTESLDEIWESRLERASTQAPDEGVFADGLLKVIEARSPGKAQRSDVRDVDIEVVVLNGTIGVAVCHAENMTSLAGRLKRLQDVATKGPYKRLIVVRDGRLGIKASAKTTNERLDALGKAGHGILRPPAEAYAAIAAARELLADAAAGDLSVNGRAVDREELKTWLRGNLPLPVIELLDTLEVTGSTKSDDILDLVREWLEGQWLAPAARVASDLNLDEKTLVGRLASNQHTVGVLLGTPAVVFLRPEGLQRD